VTDPGPGHQSHPTSSASIDAKAKYAEGASALRHYSLCIFNLRTVTLAQGILLLGGTAILFRSCLFNPAAVVSIFGLLVSVALWRLQRSYWDCFDSVLHSVVDLEQRAAAPQDPLGPWASYKRKQDVVVEEFWWRLWVKHGPYWLISLAFGCVLVASIAHYPKICPSEWPTSVAGSPNPSLQRTTTGRSPGCRR